MEHFFAIITDKDLERVKDIAMCRHNVKQSKRPHIKAILDEAFDLAMECGKIDPNQVMDNNENTDNERDD